MAKSTFEFSTLFAVAFCFCLSIYLELNIYLDFNVAELPLYTSSNVTKNVASSSFPLFELPEELTVRTNRRLCEYIIRNILGVVSRKNEKILDANFFLYMFFFRSLTVKMLNAITACKRMVEINNKVPHHYPANQSFGSFMMQPLVFDILTLSSVILKMATP